MVQNGTKRYKKIQKERYKKIQKGTKRYKKLQKDTENYEKVKTQKKPLWTPKYPKLVLGND